ncbi:SAM-dependent methyltransferase [Oceanobacillus arenosus]|uniref:SAM-dependent methyltransferase n=1 Tax=Oceanobacillus arenosus TaxID=1229153 RepID=A0A3D8PJU9_9BACI|nr:class I SAM-dependent methyltransferase [Oceanobacillus arenosus]RDW16356.1 SAM-dependent methyltransferase [Oceanobacillus arenosus]
MDKSNVEPLFEWLDHTTELIQQHNDEPYLDSLAVTMETLFFNDTAVEMDEILSRKLKTELAKIDLSSYATIDIRKAIQLAILKGMKDSTQQQHLMTPETVALIIGYLADQLMKGKDSVRLFDPASGTGNLITTVLEQLKHDVVAFASEVDSTLIQLSLLNANLQKKQIEFFHQDSLRPFLLDPVDLVVADLPVGYYPDDVRANDFELKADTAHSYAHHLFIEQGLNYTKEAGYLILVIPDFLFDSDQSDKLHRYLQAHAHIVGVIRLPESAFKSKANVKSILILQKKGEHTETPKQPLLVQMPAFKNANGMADILGQMNAWFQTYQK